MGEEKLATLIRRQFDGLKPLPNGLHRRAMGLLREYILVGGMPGPVSIYVAQRKFEPVDTAKRQILSLYRNRRRAVCPRLRIQGGFGAGRHSRPAVEA